MGWCSILLLAIWALLHTSVYSALSSPGVVSQQNNLSVGTKLWLGVARAECSGGLWKQQQFCLLTFETQRFSLLSVWADVEASWQLEREREKNSGIAVSRCS